MLSNLDVNLEQYRKCSCYKVVTSTKDYYPTSKEELKQLKDALKQFGVHGTVYERDPDRYVWQGRF